MLKTGVGIMEGGRGIRSQQHKGHAALIESNAPFWQRQIS